ncbi:MAG: hypothetical protein U1E21_10630 [Reyranellaceae bacterium]
MGDDMNGVELPATIEGTRDLLDRVGCRRKHDGFDARAKVREKRLELGDRRIDEEDFANHGLNLPDAVHRWRENEAGALPRDCVKPPYCCVGFVQGAVGPGGSRDRAPAAARDDECAATPEGSGAMSCGLQYAGDITETMSGQCRYAPAPPRRKRNRPPCAAKPHLPRSVVARPRLDGSAAARLGMEDVSTP